MKYYRIECSTPYCGEQNYYYLATEEKKDSKVFLSFIDDCLNENANEWYDEQAQEDYPDWEDYLSSCDYTVEEITKEEYDEESI